MPTPARRRFRRPLQESGVGSCAPGATASRSWRRWRRDKYPCCRSYAPAGRRLLLAAPLSRPRTLRSPQFVGRRNAFAGCVVDLVGRREAAHADANARIGALVVEPECFQYVARSGTAARTGRLRRNSDVTHVADQNSRIDCRKSQVGRIANAVVRVSVDPCPRNGVEYLALETITQRCEPRALGVEMLCRNLHRSAHANDARHVQRPGPPSSFLSAACQQRRPICTRCPMRRQNEDARAGWTIEFVCRKCRAIDRSRYRLQSHFPTTWAMSQTRTPRPRDTLGPTAPPDAWYRFVIACHQRHECAATATQGFFDTRRLTWPWASTGRISRSTPAVCSRYLQHARTALCSVAQVMILLPAGRRSDVGAQDRIEGLRGAAGEYHAYGGDSEHIGNCLARILSRFCRAHPQR